MKLLNPTDQELDAAFAEHVAGCAMLDREPEMTANPKPTCVKYEGKWLWVEWDKPLDDDPKHWVGEMRPLNFTRSFDEVLPWLQKRGDWKIVGWQNGNAYVDTWSGTDHATLYSSDVTHGIARAAVIALLRANGHEVTFT